MRAPVQSTVPTFVPRAQLKSKANKNSHSAFSDMQNIDHRQVTEKFIYGERLMSNKDLKKYVREMKMMGIPVTIDKYGKLIPENKLGGFAFEIGKIFLRKPVTKHTALHEMIHAKQWLKLGKEQYKELGIKAREEHVFRELIDGNLLNDAELLIAKKYLYQIRYGQRSPHGWKGEGFE